MKIMRFVRLSMVVVAVAAVAVLAAACGGSSDTPAAASPSPSASAVMPTASPTSSGGADDTSNGVKVSIADMAFSPSKIEVKAGTTVTWTNNDTTEHSVTSTKGDDIDSAVSGLFDSGVLQPGQTFSYTFKKAGDYPYECMIHATMKSMHGKIEVKK